MLGCSNKAAKDSKTSSYKYPRDEAFHKKFITFTRKQKKIDPDKSTNPYVLIFIDHKIIVFNYKKDFGFRIKTTLVKFGKIKFIINSFE
jgi:hypothetical protein